MLSSVVWGRSLKTMEKRVIASYHTHNITWPFITLSPPNVGLKTGLELDAVSRHRKALVLTSNLGWYYDAHFATGVYINESAGFRYSTPINLFLDIALGIGYLHNFPTRRTFTLEDGKYVKRVDPGRPCFMGLVNIGMGYRFNDAASLFLRYEWFVQVPYREDWPVVPHGCLHIGMGMTISAGDADEKR